jgi:uncharacterized protein YaaQ
VQEVLHNVPQLELEEMQAARRELLRAQRSTLANLRRDGVVSEESYTELVTEIDLALESGVDMWARYLIDSGQKPNVTHLVSAVVQDEDAVQSKGGLLNQTNHVFLVGIPDGHLEEVVGAIEDATTERVKYLEHPLTELGAPDAAPRPVDIHGATVFVIDVDRYEEI